MHAIPSLLHVWHQMQGTVSYHARWHRKSSRHKLSCPFLEVVDLNVEGVDVGGVAAAPKTYNAGGISKSMRVHERDHCMHEHSMTVKQTPRAMCAIIHAFNLWLHEEERA